MSEGEAGAAAAADAGCFWESEEQQEWAFAADSLDNYCGGGNIIEDSKAAHNNNDQQGTLDFASSMLNLDGPHHDNINENDENNNNNNNNNLEEEEVAAPSTGKRSSSNKGGRREGGGGDVHTWTERVRRKKMRTMFASLHSWLPHLPSKADKSTIVDEAIKSITTLQDTLQKLEKQKMERHHHHHHRNYDGISSSSSSSSSPLFSQRNILALHQQHHVAEKTREAFLADYHYHHQNGSSSRLSSIIPRYPAVNIRTFTSQNVALNVCGDAAHISVCSTKKAGLLSAVSYVCEKHKLEVVSAQVSSDNHRIMLMIHVHVNGGGQEQFSSVEEVFKRAAEEMMFWVTTST